VSSPPAPWPEADLERRFGGLRRLYGDAHYPRLRALRVAVVGLGGVGSWAAEALARSGVAALTLIDMDHVAESNINRQVQALGATVGQAKGEALRTRIADIHPGCELTLVDDFVAPGNWPALLPAPVDVLIDACDQVSAKLAMALWAVQGRHVFVTVGAAGGKRLPQAIEVADLSAVTHDPLLASLRQRLRKQLREAEPVLAAPALRGVAGKGAAPGLGVRCVFSREAVLLPSAVCDVAGGTPDATLNCHGYGSSVMVTASFGMAAAAEAIQCALAK
jgi:tRNA threonylcarbamoyladenosine dehydratase